MFGCDVSKQHCVEKKSFLSTTATILRACSMDELHEWIVTQFGTEFMVPSVTSYRLCSLDPSVPTMKLTFEVLSERSQRLDGLL